MDPDKTMTREQAECLVRAFREMSGLKGVGRDSQLMLCWYTVNDLIRHSLQFGGWRFYYDSGTDRMEIK